MSITIRLTAAQSDFVQDIATIVGEGGEPVHPTLFQAWDDGTLNGVKELALTADEWAMVGGDALTYEENRRSFCKAFFDKLVAAGVPAKDIVKYAGLGE